MTNDMSMLDPEDVPQEVVDLLNRIESPNGTPGPWVLVFERSLIDTETESLEYSTSIYARGSHATKIGLLKVAQQHFLSDCCSPDDDEDDDLL